MIVILIENEIKMMAEKKKKILIAEDERPMARALELKLSHEGYDVTYAANGQEALDFLKKDKFDIILLDLMMPKVDGFGVLEEMKAKKMKIPVIILSNLSQVEDEERAKKMGAKDFFIKSNTPIANIIDYVKKHL